ncbi:MAG TPA: hypothetical protein PKD83_03645 [Ignavibacteria bacterium]|nr:hypothetical protein [Ignavibacteria bacterium]
MKKIFTIVLLFILLIISGCEKGTVRNVNNSLPENKNAQKEIQESPVNKISQNIFKGNYIKTNYLRSFRECATKKKFIIAPEGDIALLDELYDKRTDSLKISGLYIEAEGFSSERSRKESTGMDTILVITKFIMSDESTKCD